MAGILRDTIRREGLQDRVQMLGAVPTHAVRDVLVSTKPRPCDSVDIVQYPCKRTAQSDEGLCKMLGAVRDVLARAGTPSLTCGTFCRGFSTIGLMQERESRLMQA